MGAYLPGYSQSEEEYRHSKGKGQKGKGYDEPKSQYGAPSEESSYRDSPKGKGHRGKGKGKGGLKGYRVPEPEYAPQSEEHYGPPRDNYGPPPKAKGYRKPEPQYGPPSEEHYGPPPKAKGYREPDPQYGPPSEEHYGPPPKAKGYREPEPQYGPPSEEHYEPPRDNYGPPPKGNRYKEPEPQYGAPSEEHYEPPRGNYGAPPSHHDSVDYGPPKSTDIVISEEGHPGNYVAGYVDPSISSSSLYVEKLTPIQTFTHVDRSLEGDLRSLEQSFARDRRSPSEFRSTESGGLYELLDSWFGCTDYSHSLHQQLIFHKRFHVII